MTSAELLTAIRIRLDDNALPVLVSDETIFEQASFTQVEFARATLAFYDVVSGAITAGIPWIDLPSNLCVLKSIILNNIQLRPITISELDFGYFTLTTENSGRFSNWRAITGTPKFVVVDMYPDKVRLVPSPTANATVSLEGYIIPSDITISASPTIPDMYGELLVSGTLLRLYSLFDVDVFNSSKAQVYGTQWYQGLAEAQNNLRTSLRRQVRVMELPRGFIFDTSGSQASTVNTQASGPKGENV